MMRILIADDDRMSRELLMRVLEKQGHEVVATQDGEAAWSALQSGDSPRLLIVDWMMPRLDGIELTRRIRDSEGDSDSPCHILMLTSRSERDQAAAAMRAGVDDFVSKPFHPEELQARVEVGARILALQNRLSQVARTDPLTGLPNRRPAEEALKRELARHARDGRALQVAIIDADHFKRVNDTLGHQAGDEVLRELGRRVQAELRPYDLLCRIGGEEFLVINPGNMNALQPWERLREAVVEKPIPTPAGEVRLTISIGVAIVLRSSSSEEVFAAADRALYRAKNDGRDRVMREWLGAVPELAAETHLIGQDLAPPGYSSCSRISCAATAANRLLVVGGESCGAVVGDALKDEGYEIACMRGERELWTSLQSTSAPAVVVLERAIAEPEGFTLVRALRAYHSQTHLPIHLIVLASPTELEQIAGATDAGADDFLLTPISPAEMRAKSKVWNRAIATYRAQSQLVDRYRVAQDQLGLLDSTARACEHCVLLAKGSERETRSRKA